MSGFEFCLRSYDLKLLHTFSISRSSRDAQTNVFLKLSRDGLNGFGEASPNTRYEESPEAVHHYLNAACEVLENDLSPRDLPQAFSELEKIKKIKPVYSAKLALETAYLDWYSRSKGVSVREFLGLTVKKTPPSSYTIGIDDIPVMQQKVLERPDFSVYKIKLGSGNDREIIQGIREVTDRPLRVDANEGWKDLETAKREIEYLHAQGAEMVEQPMPSSMFEEMCKLREWSPLPLCADESFKGPEDLNRLKEAFDVINIKLNKTGSLLQSLDILQSAHEIGLEVMIGCMLESSLGIGTGAILATQADHADLDGHILISNDPFSGLSWSEDYRLILPDGPGLGLLPNESAPF